MATTKDERTLGEMFAELSQETRTLVQQELRLAKTELTEKASQVGKGAGLIVGGGLIAYGGLLAIIAAIVLIMMSGTIDAIQTRLCPAPSRAQRPQGSRQS